MNPKTFYQISLDGPESWHDYQRQRTGAFQRAMAAIATASASGRLTKVRMTVSDGNVNTISTLIKHLDALDRSNITLVMRPAVPSGRALENHIGLSDAYAYGALDAFKNEARVITVQTTDNMGKCGCGVDTVAIDPMGTLFPCTYFIFKPDYVMGRFGKIDLDLRRDVRFENYHGTCYARQAGRASVAATPR
jgi:sulfatase maturation enzyme AslB (radical SAM superfamily)